LSHSGRQLTRLEQRIDVLASGRRRKLMTVTGKLRREKPRLHANEKICSPNAGRARRPPVAKTKSPIPSGLRMKRRTIFEGNLAE
jgi:hypothetical protein